MVVLFCCFASVKYSFSLNHLLPEIIGWIKSKRRTSARIFFSFNTSNCKAVIPGLRFLVNNILIVETNIYFRIPNLKEEYETDFIDYGRRNGITLRKHETNP